jgi:hypothetical protein
MREAARKAEKVKNPRARGSTERSRWRICSRSTDVFGSPSTPTGAACRRAASLASVRCSSCRPRRISSRGAALASPLSSRCSASVAPDAATWAVTGLERVSSRVGARLLACGSSARSAHLDGGRAALGRA